MLSTINRGGHARISFSTCGLSNPGWLRTGAGFLGGSRGEMFPYTLIFMREYVFGACTTPARLWKIQKIYWIYMMFPLLSRFLKGF